jgi:hypothetical protein
LSLTGLFCQSRPLSSRFQRRSFLALDKLHLNTLFFPDDLLTYLTPHLTHLVAHSCALTGAVPPPPSPPSVPSNVLDLPPPNKPATEWPLSLMPPRPLALCFKPAPGPACRLLYKSHR